MRWAPGTPDKSGLPVGRPSLIRPEWQPLDLRLTSPHSHRDTGLFHTHTHHPPPPLLRHSHPFLHPYPACWVRPESLRPGGTPGLGHPTNPRINQIPRRCRSRSTRLLFLHLHPHPSHHSSNPQVRTAYSAFFFFFSVAPLHQRTLRGTPLFMLHFSPSSWLWNSRVGGKQLAPWPALRWRPRRRRQTLPVTQPRAAIAQAPNHQAPCATANRQAATVVGGSVSRHNGSRVAPTDCSAFPSSESARAMGFLGGIRACPCPP